MRVLVTGATGFAGRSVTMALLGDGHEVHGLVRDPASAESLRQAGVSLHAGDMREPGTYVPLVGQVDAIVQAAQLSMAGRVTAAKARAVFAAEHIMTSALAHACLDQRKRLVYTAAASTGATTARSRSPSRSRCHSRPWVRATPGRPRRCRSCTMSKDSTWYG